jgi:putative nucleotidyltransferase with HDIG domain
MRIERHPHDPSTSPWLYGVALAAASALGAAWFTDAQRRRRSKQLHRTMVDLLLNTLSAGDPVTERHSRRVADLTDALAATYGMGRERRARLRVASLLHDMGKIDDRFFDILHSCHPLSSEERSKIKQHPHESAYILQPMERIHPGITLIVESHHECWDGRGYPRGLRGEQIPLEARVISVADVFDAMSQPRAYKEPSSVEKVLQVIRGGAGERFDPEVVARLERPEVLRHWRRVARAGCDAEHRAAAAAD